MRHSMLYSLALHSILILLMIFGIPFLNHRPPVMSQPIPVEIVPISSETMAPRPTLKPEPKIEEPKPETPQPEPSPPEPAPEPPKPEPTPEPPKPEVKADLPPEPKKEEKVEEEPKPQPPEKPKDKPKPKNDLSAILKNLEKKKNSRKNEDQDNKKKDSKDAPEEQQVGKIGDTLTMSEMDAIRQQISKCWNIPAGARDAKELVVEVRVKVEPDGSVREVKVIDRKPAPGTETFYKSAQESARRAVIQCSPLKLPADKYDIWKDFTLTFNPKDF